MASSSSQTPVSRVLAIAFTGTYFAEARSIRDEAQERPTMGVNLDSNGILVGVSLKIRFGARYEDSD